MLVKDKFLNTCTYLIIHAETVGQICTNVQLLLVLPLLPGFFEKKATGRCTSSGKEREAIERNSSRITYEHNSKMME
jgi:hypothetical protein